MRALVRHGAILAISLAVSGIAEARRVRYEPPPTPAEPDFWREVVEPNGEEVARLVELAQRTMKIVDEAMQTDAEWAVAQRMRYWSDAHALMRHARRLSPNHADVLALLGRAADELGKTREAIEALEACIRVRGVEKAGADVLGRLGAIHLRLGKRDEAIRWLAKVNGSLRPDTTQALVHLANALAARGEVSAAVDTLVNVMPATPASHYSNELLLASFALATIYDRDEQRAAAFEVLDRMRATLLTQLAPQVQNALATMRFAPAEDRHYYQALLYEITDQYVEARAEWALYAAAGESPWRARALEHVRAIDAKLRAAPASSGRTTPRVSPIRRRP